MELHYWYLAVVVGVVVLILWGLRAARQVTTLVLAAVLLMISAFLFQTLVLDETHTESDLNGQLDALGLIGVPALLGVGLIVLAVKRAGRGRSPRGAVDKG